MFQHQHVRGKAHDIFEIVGYEDQRHLECTAQAVDFSLQTSANGTIDGRERLVKEQHRGLSCQRSCERDALPFPAGQLVWPFRIVSNKVDEIQQFLWPGRVVPLGDDGRVRS